jgi:hypothetical protein
MSQSAGGAGPPDPRAREDFFLDLWGERAPLVSPAYGLASVAHGGTPEVFVYEYFWTLGVFRPGSGGTAGRGGGPRGLLRRSEKGPRMDPALPAGYTGSAQVSLLFQRDRGCWVHELAASVKLLSPPPRDFAEEVGEDLTALQPLAGLAGSAATAVGGPVVSAAGHVLDAIAKVTANGVPSTKEFPWSVQTLCVRSGPDDWAGVVWNLPEDMLRSCGDRITGSLAVVLLPTSPGDDPLETLEIRGEARFEQEPHADQPRAVDRSLRISPQRPSSPASHSARTAMPG